MSQNGAYFSTFDHNKKTVRVASSPTNSNTNLSGNDSSSSSGGDGNSNPQPKVVVGKNCALRSGGGWWFNDFANCLPVNLNGIYVTGASAPSARGIKWQAVKVQDRNYALKRSKMKIRPSY